MKITKAKLKQIIKEELSSLSEARAANEFPKDEKGRPTLIQKIQPGAVVEDPELAMNNIRNAELMIYAAFEYFQKEGGVDSHWLDALEDARDKLSFFRGL